MKKRRDFAVRSLAILVASAFLAAISIVMGKYLAISLGEVLRISFENLPILIAGIAFGPIWGCAVGMVADLVGCLLVGYSINPLVTVGAALIGIISGTAYMILNKIDASPYWLKITASVGAAHLVGSVIVKTIGLAVYYSMPIYALMLWRLLNYLLVGSLEGVIAWYLIKNKLFSAQIDSIVKHSQRSRKKSEKDESEKEDNNI